jgi:hypothetical protein
MYRNCLQVATMWQDAGWFEKAEIHRNQCQEQFAPLCANGLVVCDGLKRRRGDEHKGVDSFWRGTRAM